VLENGLKRCKTVVIRNTDDIRKYHLGDTTLHQMWVGLKRQTLLRKERQCTTEEMLTHATMKLALKPLH
jgi:hypothetical protein